MNAWMYSGKKFDSKRVTLDKKSPDFLQGFVYKITHAETGKAYIGKKNFVRPVTKRVAGKKKRSLAESDWEMYHGSSEYLGADIEKFGHDAFTREILHLSPNKAGCSYFEAFEIFSRLALLSPTKFYNEWVSCRIRRSHLKSLFISV